MVNFDNKLSLNLTYSLLSSPRVRMSECTRDRKYIALYKAE